VTYLVRIKASAVRDLKRIDRQVRARIVAAVDGLAENPFKGTALKGEMKGLRRIRVGEHRVVYEIQDQALVVLVVRVRDRRDVYR